MPPIPNDPACNWPPNSVTTPPFLDTRCIQKTRTIPVNPCKIDQCHPRIGTNNLDAKGDSAFHGDEPNAFMYDRSHLECELLPLTVSECRAPSSVEAKSIYESFTIYDLDGQSYSPQFPPGHLLNSQFVQLYQLQDELGSGSYGFVMTAYIREVGHEVAVKFITKTSVPDHAWVEDEAVGRIPAEVILLCSIDHENIVKCIDFFEDKKYFYLIQELHGSPWHYDGHLGYNLRMSTAVNTPSLSPSTSEDSLASSDTFSVQPPVAQDSQGIMHDHTSILCHAECSPANAVTHPIVHHRPSYDLFECIEQTELKRLNVDQARYIFSQVVDAVWYLDSRGITHRDIKDENLVIDKNLKVKLIDFGSAVIVDPSRPRPFYEQFYGTTAYAAPEILLEESYQAPPAEVWTLGVLLSYILTGNHPFPTVEDAIEGKLFLTANEELSESAVDLMQRCLDPNPETRATIQEVKGHAWLIEK